MLIISLPRKARLSLDPPVSLTKSLTKALRKACTSSVPDQNLSYNRGAHTRSALGFIRCLFRSMLGINGMLQEIRRCITKAVGDITIENSARLFSEEAGRCAFLFVNGYVFQ